MTKGIAVILAVVFLFVYTPLDAAEEIVLSVEEAVAIALRDNRDIMLRTEELKKAKARLAESASQFLPTFTFTGSWQDTRGYYTKDPAQTSTQATLKQYLYRGGKTIATVEQNRHLADVSLALLDKAKLETAYAVRKAFYTLLLAIDFAEVNKKILANTRGHLDLARIRYRNGEVPESEVLSMEASLEGVQQAYEEAVNQAELAAASLNTLLNVETDSRIRPAGEFRYEPQEIAYDEAFLGALARRPEIRQYEAQIKADTSSIEASKSESRPSVYASWDYYSRSHLAATANKNWNDYNVLGLTFSWPVFDGWQAAHKVKQAVSSLKETQLLYEKTVKDIALELTASYLALKDAIARIRSAESEVKMYRDNFSSAQEKYRNGIASFLDLSDSELKYNISSFNKKQAVYDYMVAKAGFDKAAGGL